MARCAHHWFDSRCQFLNRFEGGSIELTRSSCAHPLIKSFADVGAGQPQFDVVRFFDHRRVLRTLADSRPT